MSHSSTICVVGLGYVGLPLAQAFGAKGYRTIGYDVDEERIAELKNGHDRTNELTEQQLTEAHLELSHEPDGIQEADIIILALPTPVDATNEPDLRILMSATETVGKYMKKGVIVVYESTVYPGVTEDVCGPILEKESGLTSSTDFTLGYSPERINPGDKEHTVDKIVKVVGAQDEETLEVLATLYESVVEAGVHRAPSIRVAEMAKAIENAQRDLNIAYINEIAIMCNKMGIATNDVLSAAGTKWNFLRFTPGLVGGHCIGVDPYYLIRKAKDLGMELPLISAARALNDNMGTHVAKHIIQGLREKGTEPHNASVLVLGLTFKENVPDMRNAKSEDVISVLTEAGCNVVKHDSFTEDGVDLASLSDLDAIVVLVQHDEYKQMDVSTFARMTKGEGCIFYDLKSAFDQASLEAVGFRYMAL